MTTLSLSSTSIPSPYRVAPKVVVPGTAVHAPRFFLEQTPAATIFRIAAQKGPISRENIAQLSGVSIATVNRNVAALLTAGLLLERHDLTASGAVGRPRVPIQINHEPYATIGIHIGAAVTTIVASDVRGTILGGIRIPTPAGPQHNALTSIATSASAFAARFRRKFLWAGIALGGQVDPTAGTASHHRLQWTHAPIGHVIGKALKVPVSVAPHVEAMAAAELLLGPHEPANNGESSHLYFYARETVGVALTYAERVITPRGGPGSIAHLPSGSAVLCDCGQKGCLEATVSEDAIMRRAISAGIALSSNPSLDELIKVARAGNLTAATILKDRARTLGKVVATLRDLFNPDQVTLGGQAFTSYPEAMRDFAQSFDQSTRSAGRNVLVTGFGNKVQEHAAVAVSLSVLHADPLNAPAVLAPA